MTKKFGLLIGLAFTFSMQAQETEKEKITIFGGLESNSQYYLDDDKLGDFIFEDRFRSNNYLLLNAKYKKFTTGIQVEGYENQALLNYNPEYKGTNLGTYYLNYKSNKIDITLGHFYEQFGSGLLLRNWEDRALGINNALMGARIKYQSTDNVLIKALYGKQRTGFGLTDSNIYGLDADFALESLFKLENSFLNFGMSYVGRQEKIEIENPNFEEITHGIAGRLDYSKGSFYASTEYNYKTADAILDTQGNLNNDFVKEGNAVTLNTGFTQKGFGVDMTLRRIENMNFYSERTPTKYNTIPESTSINYNDKILNYTPGLTKQHHYNLANIYVYQAQAKVDFSDATITKAGETGGQIDLFYNIKKDTKLGGKYGTKVALNFANWYNLAGEYKIFPADYDTKFFGVSQRYFTDFNLEVTKKISKSLHTNFAYINQYYNQRLIEGGGIVTTNIIAAEASYLLDKGRSIRFQGEHMWAEGDRKNWVGGTLEYNFNNKLGVYVWDMYNYGNSNEVNQIHYYNVGGSYRKGASRIAINYGRQRGGLVCVGGVCRNVPQSKGISLSFNTAF